MTRVLIWSPNYAPELTGIPPLVTDAAEWLAQQGHRVEVVTAMPNYPERRIASAYRGALWRTEKRGAVLVHRSWLRVRPEERFVDKALYELTFASVSLPLAVRSLRRADVVVCLVPVVLAALYAGLLARLGFCRVVLWIQDLVITAAASLDGSGSVAKGLLALGAKAESAAARSADRLVVCSPGFIPHLVNLGVRPEAITLLPNWTDVDEIEPVERERSRRTRFLYAGNLGYTQGFETLVAAAQHLDGDCDVEIVGEGNAARYVRELARGKRNVHVRPPVQRPEFPRLLTASDVHVVIQRTVSAGANFPSKIASYLASGRPIVASIAPDTPAAQVLIQTGAALLVPPEDPSKLAEAMLRLHQNPELRLALGRAGRVYAEREFDRKKILPRFEQAIVG